MRGIADWLKDLQLEQYAERFAENAIDFSVLPDLTDQDLEKMGVLLGHRVGSFLRTRLQCQGDRLGRRGGREGWRSKLGERRVPRRGRRGEHRERSRKGNHRRKRRARLGRLEW